MALLTEVVEAWLTTIDSQGGIFDRSFDLSGVRHASNTGDPDNLADDSLLLIVSDVDDLKAHHLWVTFLLEAWQVSVLPLTYRLRLP